MLRPRRTARGCAAVATAGRAALGDAQAISTLSATVALVKICGTWNEREMPAAMTARGGSFVISRPRKAIVPLLGFR